MPLELIILAFVLVAFVAIAARFMPRDAAGRRRLPRIVDESVGMYVLRRATGRPTEAASDVAKAETEADAIVPEEAIAYRIGVPGAPEPTVPTRFVVAKAPPQAHKIPPVVPVVTRPVARGRPQARRGGALPFQRRLAALGTLFAVLLVGFAALSLPRGPEEAVLSATGTPRGTITASALAVAPTPSLTEPSLDTDTPEPAASPSPSTSLGPTPTVVTPAPVVLTPTATPRRTPPPTPRITPPPTPKPTPTPTKPPTPPPPTPPPTPEPTPVPPSPSFDFSCAPGSLTVTFTGDGGPGTVGNVFEWVFGDEGAGSGQEVTHTFAGPSEPVVKLTVTNAGGTDSVQQAITVPC